MVSHRIAKNDCLGQQLGNGYSYEKSDSIFRKSRKLLFRDKALDSFRLLRLRGQIFQISPNFPFPAFSADFGKMVVKVGKKEGWLKVIAILELRRDF